MKKTIVAVLVLFGLGLLIAAISTVVFPEWLEIPGGWLAALGVAILGAAALAGGVKDLRDLLFPEKDSGGEEVNVTGDRSQVATGEGGRNIQAENYTEIHAGQVTLLEQRSGETTSPGGSAPPRPRVHEFIHRGKIQEELRAALRNRERAAVVGVRGMGGIGKTELAKQLAHELESETPGATLWVEIGDRSLEAVHAHMARALKVEFSPDLDAEGRAALLRAALSQAPRAVFLDDVRRSFVPYLKYCLPPENCALLVTSRLHELPGIPAGALRRLDVMDETQALALLSSIPGLKDALESEPQPARDLCAACAYHPLALDIAARRLLKHLGRGKRPVETFVNNLHDRLPRLSRSDDPSQSLRANFDLSYHDLPAADQRRFRWLAAFHPSGFSVPGAAALWEEDSAQALAAVERLEEASLLQPGEQPGRFRMHDLLHDFALEKLEEAGEHHAAMRGMADYLIRLFDQHFTDDPSTAPHVLAELDNLRRAARWAAGQKDGDLLGQLAYKPRNWFYNVFRINEEWETWLESALGFGIEDTRLEANCIKSLGDVHVRLSELPEARARYEEALPIYRAIGDKLGEANCIQRLGDAFLEMEDFKTAEELYSQALEIARTISPAEEASALNSLASLYEDQKDYQRAIEIYTRALEIFPRHAYIVRNRALIHLKRKNAVNARQDLKLAAHLQPEHPFLFLRLGQLAILEEKFKDALSYFESALELLPRLSDAWFGIGLARLHLHNPDAALEAYQQGLAVTTTPTDLEDAIEDLEELLASRPELPGIAEAFSMLRNFGSNLTQDLTGLGDL